MRTLLLAAAGLVGLSLMTPAPQDASSPPRQAAFALDEIVERGRKSGLPWTEFLDRPSMFAGVYRLAAGAEDGQGPHEADELYHVVEGRATLVAGDERFPAEPGSVFFVEREVEHRFVDIEEDLVVLVFFSRFVPEPGDE